MKWIKEYETYKEEPYHIFYTKMSERIRKYSEQFNKIFNIFGINSIRTNLKLDKDRMALLINLQIKNGKHAMSDKLKGCIVPIFLHKDVDMVEFINKNDEAASVINVVFFKNEDDFTEFDNFSNKNALPSVIYECIYKDDDSSMMCIIKTIEFYLLNLTDKLSFSNLNDSLADNIIEEFPLRKILLRYCNALTKKDLFSIDGALDELYDIMYDELRNYSGIHELMIKIKEKLPDLYNKFMIKGDDDLEELSNLGQMGF